LGIKEWKSTVISTEELKNISKYDPNMISISSIISIYSFLDISEDYKDPLEKISKEYVEHWLDNTKIPMLIKPDLKTYIERFK